MSDAAARPFSMGWAMLSLVLFLAFELVIGQWLAPLVVGAYVSPMFHTQTQMLLHLVALYLGGLAVGLVSPGRRLLEPAVGAFCSVLLSFLMSFFMPSWFFVFDLMKIAVGGGIAFFVALAGAWHGESLMGNLEEQQLKASLRGRVRATLWEEDSSLAPRVRERTRD